MRSCCTLVTWSAGMLSILSLMAAPLSAQSAPASQKAAAQTQPAIPQAYQLDVRNVLAYQVASTTRAGAAPAMPTKYREMVVFDIDDQENLVLYVGSPGIKTVAASAAPASPPRPMEKHSVEHRPATPPTEHKPAVAEEPEKVQLVWTKHVLGKTFTRNADGTISFRPAQGEVMPYPVLPLPPVELKDKERFELTVPDLALGEGKTIAVIGTYKVSPEGKLTVDCRMEPKIVPGGMPEIAVLGYDVPASAGGRQCRSHDAADGIGSSLSASPRGRRDPGIPAARREGGTRR